MNTPRLRARLAGPCLLASIATAALLPARAAANDIPAYGGPWPVLHHDNRNSDCADVQIADAYSRVFINIQPQVNYNRPVIGTNGDVYFTYSSLQMQDGQVVVSGQSLGAFDGVTGDALFTVSSPTVDSGIVAANALVDSDGSLYVADDAAITKLNASGSALWSVPIKGAVASSLQFTPGGQVLGFTWNGWVYVVARSDGRIILEQNMTPNRAYPTTRPGGCLLNGNSNGCAYANTPAVSPADSRIYQTYMPADASRPAAVHAYRLTSSGLSLLWSNAGLAGGTASSVAVSADYQRLYVSDNANHLVALRGSDGSLLWSLDVGYAPRSSVIVNDDGYLMPGGTAQDPNYRIMLIHDTGAAAEIVYENADYTPVSNPVAGLDDRFAVLAKNEITGALELLVLDPSGIVSASPWGDNFPPDQLGGLVLNDDGWIYVTGLDGRTGLVAFRPYQDHQDVETGMVSDITEMISLRYMRHLWTASDGTMAAVVQQGGHDGHGLALYRSVDGGATWDLDADLLPDQVISDGVLLADDSLLLASSVFSDGAVVDVDFMRLEYDAATKQWWLDPSTPTTVFASSLGNMGSRATLATDSNGVIWVAFRTRKGDTYQIGLYYSADGGSTWQDSGNLFTTANTLSNKAAKVLAAGGGIAVIMQDERGSDVASYRYKSWSFRNDSDPLQAPMGFEDIAQMETPDGDMYGSHWTAAADSAGNLHLSYEDGTIRYLKYDASAGSWESPVSLATADVTYNSLSVGDDDDLYVFARFDAADKIYVSRYVTAEAAWSDWVSVSRQPYDGFLRMASPERFEGRLPLLYQVSSSPSRLLFNDVAVDFLDMEQ